MNNVRTIAFYLPQFHPIPENDQWWGEGFTEWTNVRRATPVFSGHDHPRVPTELGEYDLRESTVLHEQAELARANGIDGFCFYYYWFAGKRLLETPLDLYLAGGPDFPFCISWANENWSRRWDGKEHELLIAQDYDSTTAEDVFNDFERYLADPRYLKQDGKLVIVVHRADHLPNPRQFAETWRRLAAERGLGTLHLVAAETRPNIDPRELGFDAVAEFPPVGSNTLRSALLTPPEGVRPSFRGRLMSYPRTARRYMKRRTPAFRRHPGVMPGWDNSARRGDQATIYVNATPSAYAEWLRAARSREAAHGDQGLVFVNAWNEWAEGAYLEPDASNGSEYLLATRLDRHLTGADARNVPSVPASVGRGNPGLPWAHSITLATMASGLNAARLVRDALGKLSRS